MTLKLYLNIKIGDFGRLMLSGKKGLGSRYI